MTSEGKKMKLRKYVCIGFSSKQTRKNCTFSPHNNTLSCLLVPLAETKISVCATRN